MKFKTVRNWARGGIHIYNGYEDKLEQHDTLRTSDDRYLHK